MVVRDRNKLKIEFEKEIKKKFIENKFDDQGERVQGIIENFDDIMSKVELRMESGQILFDNHFYSYDEIAEVEKGLKHKFIKFFEQYYENNPFSRDGKIGLIEKFLLDILFSEEEFKAELDNKLKSDSFNIDIISQYY